MEPKSIISLIVIVFFGIPLAITDIVLSTQSTSCDTTDQIGLNVSQYLLGLGISELIIISFILICVVGNVYDNSFLEIGFIGSFFGGIFGLIWLIIGGIILFRSNVDCIRSGTTMVLYALILWCVSAYLIVIRCNRSKNRNEEV